MAQALQEYGRLIRTLHVLRWYANNEDRRRVMRQLNKGEALHDLRAYLMIANKGNRRKRGEELVNQASCLNLPTFKGGYKLEVNFGEKCQQWVVARYSAEHVEHYGGNISVFIGTFLSATSLHIEKK